jgi:hypothetical protein
VVILNNKFSKHANMLKAILTVLVLVTSLVLGVWAFMGNEVDNYIVNKGSMKNWPEEIPSEVPPYLIDNIVESSVLGSNYQIKANSNTMDIQRYYEKFLREGWEVITPLEVDEDVNLSNVGKLKKDDTTVELYLNYGILNMSVEAN